MVNLVSPGEGRDTPAEECVPLGQGRRQRVGRGEGPRGRLRRGGGVLEWSLAG